MNRSGGRERFPAAFLYRRVLFNNAEESVSRV